MELSSSHKKLTKLFYTLNKTPFGETGCLSNLYYLLTVQASSFLIHFLFPNTIIQETFGTLKKIHFQNCFFKKYISKLIPKKYVLKILLVDNSFHLY